MIIIEFRALTKADKPLLDRYFKSRYYENSHFNFTNLFMWRKPYHIKWCEEDGVLYMTAEWDGQLMALQPYGPEEKMQEATAKFLAYFEAQDRPFFMTGMEKSYAAVLEQYEGAAFSVEADRDNYDYVYLAEKLITLSGRKLHSKKNHLNAFRKLYPQAEYLPMTQEILPACLDELQRLLKLRVVGVDGGNREGGHLIGLLRISLHHWEIRIPRARDSPDAEEWDCRTRRTADRLGSGSR